MSLAEQKKPIKIGVLAPTSNYFPSFSKSILSALRLGLDNHGEGVEYELFIEIAGYNAKKSEVTSALQKLIIQNEVDIITTPMNTGLLTDIKPIISAEQIPLIVNTLGEDVCFKNAQNPHILVNSLGLWQSAWLNGFRNVANYGSQSCSISAFHEAGYGLNFAYALGTEANKGKIIGTQVTHQDSANQDPSAMINELLGLSPDSVMGFYAGKEALSFLEAWKKSEAGRNNLPLTLSSCAMETLREVSIIELAEGVHSISCWDQATSEAQQFINNYQLQTGMYPHSYALLAYETGQLIATATKKIDSLRSSGQANLLEALLETGIAGPRGTLAFDSLTHEIVIDTFYLHHIEKNTDGGYDNPVIEIIKAPELLNEQHTLAQNNIDKQGWLNPYLVA